MSLAEVIEEQGAIRQMLAQLQQRFDDNERKIATLTNGGGGGKGMGRRALGGGGGYPAPASAPAKRSPMGGMGRGGGGGGYPAAPPRSPTQPLSSPGSRPQPAGYTTVSPTYWGGAARETKRTCTTEELKNMVKNIVDNRSNRLADEDIWHEDKGDTSIAGIDRCEALLKKAFDEYRRSMVVRGSASPFTALQAIFRMIDASHSGKIDLNEFMAMPKALGFQAQPGSLKGLFERFDLDRSGLIDDEEFCRLLLKPEGDTGAKAKSVLAKMREVLCYRAGGFPSMKAMGRQFRIIDRDNSGRLDKEEMDIMLDNFFNHWKIKFTPDEKKSLFQFFDKDNEGTIDYNEYIRAVRGDMNPFREEFVMKAFAILDVDGSGQIEKEEIMSKYDVSKNPDVISGKIAPGEAYELFMNNYDTNADGIISSDEFIEAYQWISASIDSDDYFELMMRNAWHISGGEGWSENTSNLRVLVTFYDGAQKIVGLDNDLGLDKYDQRAVLQRLHQQGCRNIQKIELFGGMEA